MCILCDLGQTGTNEVIKVAEPVTQVGVEPVSTSDLVINQSSQLVFAKSAPYININEATVFIFITITAIVLGLMSFHYFLEHRKKKQ